MNKYKNRNRPDCPNVLRALRELAEAREDQRTDYYKQEHDGGSVEDGLSEAFWKVAQAIDKLQLGPVSGYIGGYHLDPGSYAVELHKLREKLHSCSAIIADKNGDFKLTPRQLEELGIGGAGLKELYAAIDRLNSHQTADNTLRLDHVRFREGGSSVICHISHSQDGPAC